MPHMDLKASAEHEVRERQDIVKRSKKQNEILRHSSSQNGAGIISKKDSVKLVDVTLINLNDHSDEPDDSWCYESPVIKATPAQKSLSPTKWAKTLNVDGLDNVRRSLIDKLHAIETRPDFPSLYGQYRTRDEERKTIQKTFDMRLLDLKASAEQKVRKRQDMVKRLE